MNGSKVGVILIGNVHVVNIVILRCGNRCLYETEDRTMTVANKEEILDMNRTEISAATGSKYGYYECKCGKRQTPYYRDPRNIRIPNCHPCGKSMKWKNAT